MKRFKLNKRTKHLLNSLQSSIAVAFSKIKYYGKRNLKPILWIVLSAALIATYIAYQNKHDEAVRIQTQLEQTKALEATVRAEKEAVEKAKADEKAKLEAELTGKSGELNAKQTELIQKVDELQQKDIQIRDLEIKLETKRATQARLASATKATVTNPVSAKIAQPQALYTSTSTVKPNRIYTGYTIGSYQGQCVLWVQNYIGISGLGNGIDAAHTLVRNHGWRYSTPKPGSVGSQGTGWGHTFVALQVSGSQVLIGESNYMFNQLYNERWILAGEAVWASR